MAKVLIVDDELSILRSTAALLDSFGHEVATCAQAADILQAIARERPDVLLQDVRMPGLDVHRLVAAIRDSTTRAEEAGDRGTADLLTGQVRELDKALFLLEAHVVTESVVP